MSIMVKKLEGKLARKAPCEFRISYNIRALCGSYKESQRIMLKIWFEGVNNELDNQQVVRWNLQRN